MRIGKPRTRRERAEALACLLGGGRSADSARAQEALRLADSGEIDLGGLVAVWRGMQAVAATISCVGADGSVFVWPPETRSAGHREEAIDLLRDIVAQADADGCPFTQSAVETGRGDQQFVLEAAGFRFLTELLCLQRPLDSLLPSLAASGSVVAFRDPLENRFAALIERTYAASRDCPAFAGLRSAAAALKSYRAAGDFTPERWRLLEHRGRDAAVILVNDRPDERAREIIYLGVIPEARRDGLARVLLQQALREAAQQGLDCVLTSADAANLPAVTLYSRAGFSPVSRRSIYLRRPMS